MKVIAERLAKHQETGVLRFPIHFEIADELGPPSFGGGEVGPEGSGQGGAVGFADPPGPVAVVEVGDVVKKGQQIGTVGSSGTSTAPHCHYEIHQDGRPVDPIHFCLDGLSPSEYKAVVERAAAAGVSFD